MHNLINKERLTSFFLDLVKIPSPSYQEKAVFDYLQQKLTELGLTTEYKSFGKSGNLCAFLEANNDTYPTILLSGHADTVTPCQNIKPILKDGKIQSDGTTILGGDDKCALAEFLEVLSIILENNLPHGRIELAITAAEEVGLQGAKKLEREWFQAKDALILDSSGDIGSVAIAAPNHDCFEITVHGKKAHAGIEPEAGISAIKAAAELIKAFPTGRLDKQSVANFGTIHGGEATNIVADKVILKGEVRSHSNKLSKKYLDRLSNTVEKISKKKGVSMELDIVREYKAYRAAPESTLLHAVENSCLALGIPFQKKIAGGGSDASVINELGINSLNLACGMHLVHTNQEYTLVEELASVSALLVDILTKQLQGQHKTSET